MSIIVLLAKFSTIAMVYTAHAPMEDFKMMKMKLLKKTILINGIPEN